jgi:hypothetical protein
LGKVELDAVEVWIAGGREGPQPFPYQEARRVLTVRLTNAIDAREAAEKTAGGRRAVAAINGRRLKGPPRGSACGLSRTRGHDMNFDMKVEADRVIAQMTARKARVPDSLAKIVTELTGKLLTAVQQRAPVKTGKLRRSIFEEVTVNNMQALGRVYVSPDTAYAKFVEYETKPHDIYPTKASVLAFIMGGKQVFAKMVHHPGTKAQMYLHGPFEEMKPEIVARIEGAMRDAIK